MKKTFLKDQFAKLDTLDVVYYSVDIKLSQKDDRIKKEVDRYPPYRNKTLLSYYDKDKNGCLIPLGKRYNLIGVDIDTFSDTLDFFKKLAIKHKCKLDTLTVKTVNGGFHYYFRLSEEQQEELSDFNASTAACFNPPNHTELTKRHIDIKYNNQLFFGPMYNSFNKEIKKYEIVNNVKPCILPDYLFKEICRTRNNTSKTVAIKPNFKKDSKKVVDETDEDVVEQEEVIKEPTLKKQQKEVKLKEPKLQELKATESNVNKEEILRRESRLKLYLDCLKVSRFVNYQDWFSIGSIIFNEGCNISLFLEYSKKSKDYDEKGCIKVWNSFTDLREKRATITKLIEMAKLDTEHSQEDKIRFFKAVINDKEGILSMLYADYTGIYLTYLFYVLEKENYVYDAVNDKMYNINKYGIYTEDIKNNTLAISFDASVVREIENECNRLQEQVELQVFEDDPVKRKKIVSDKQLVYYNTSLKLLKYCTKIKNRTETFQSIKPYLTVPGITDILDNANPYLVGFLNGVYDLETNKFRNAKLTEYVSITTGYLYEKADSKLKKKAFDIITSIFPNKEELEYVLKHIALGLLGNNPEEKYFIWIGSGSNGKGLLSCIVELVLGNYCDTLDITQLYKSAIAKKDAANSSMAKKRHCRFIISTEPDKNTLLDNAIIKKISGNDLIETRALYGQTIKYKPKSKLTIQTNREPRFSDFDSGLKRRTVLINFPNKFLLEPDVNIKTQKKIDIDLKSQLEQNMYRNEFLEILIDYFNMYIKDKKEKGCGLILPERFLKDTNNFIKNNDPVNDWIKEEVTITNKSTDLVRSNALYESYKLYHQGDVRGVSQYDIKEMFAELGIETVRKSTGVYYKGITIEEVEEDDDD
jgi:P4 family phage/plasmid primase-like protien